MPRGPGYRQPNDWARTKRRILNRDRRRCYVCGASAVTVDHVVPVAEGGSHDDRNLAAICGTCHDTKTKAEAARGVRRFAAKRMRPAEPHPGAIPPGGGA